MTESIAPRTICARTLCRWLISGDFPDRVLPDQVARRPLIQEMVFGCVRWKRFLEWILERQIAREPDPLTKAYLLTGLYQLFCMDHIPAHAALNETVEEAKADLDPYRIRFVNGVLRNVLRKQSQIRQEASLASDGIRLSHPDDLLKRWSAEFGPTVTEALCNWNNMRPTVSIRILAGNNHPEIPTLREMLTPHPADPDHFLLVPAGTEINRLPGYESGAFYVQDPATHLAVELLELEPGVKMLDACAAPGGKAIACADQIRNQGSILATDMHEDRLKRLHENIARTVSGCIEVVQADATASPAPGPVLDRAPFDRILLDVPCSNTGVLNRRPDARWRFSEKRLETLVSLQTRMLDAASQLLSEDGILVYSTCSLEPEENLLQVHQWLARHPGFKVGRLRLNIPPASGADGAFAAQLIRSKN